MEERRGQHHSRSSSATGKRANFPGREPVTRPFSIDWLPGEVPPSSGTLRDSRHRQKPLWGSSFPTGCTEGGERPALARAIGWDIAIADRGTILIEGNAEWFTSLLHIPAPRGLMSGEPKSLCDILAAGQT